MQYPGHPTLTPIKAEPRSELSPSVRPCCVASAVPGTLQDAQGIQKKKRRQLTSKKETSRSEFPSPFSALPTLFCLPVQHHEGPRGCCLCPLHCGPLLLCTKKGSHPTHLLLHLHLWENPPWKCG